MIREDDREKYIPPRPEAKEGAGTAPQQKGEDIPASKTKCPMVGDVIDKPTCIVRSTRRERLCKESGCGG